MWPVPNTASFLAGSTVSSFRRKPESALPLKGRDGREMDA